MKLRNKKTGEIRDFNAVIHELNMFGSLAELNAEWEDYEEPKGTALYWMILTLENFIENEPDDKWVDLEDCKKMLEKLKAWKRLKDKGFVFCGNYGKNGENIINFEFGERPLSQVEADEAENDLDLLFGGEE